MNDLNALIKVPLPADYLRFISLHNGGVCRVRTIHLENDMEVLCDCLFGVNLENVFDIHYWSAELAGDLPENCIPIGCDPGGAFYLLILAETGWEIMYYDHAYSLASS